MLTILLCYLVISCCCVAAGFLVSRVPALRAVLAGASFAAVWFTGLVTLTAITQVACLFIPINASFQLIVLGLLLVGCYGQRAAFVGLVSGIRDRLRSTGPVEKTGAVLLLIMILVINAGPVQSDDTESYHIQMIKWLKEYGTVPGLVHLHSRFGFNSGWFSSVAFFKIPSGHLNYFTALNGSTALLLVLFLWSRVCRRTVPGIRGAAALVIAYCLYSWPLFRGNAGNVGYDLIATCMIVVLAFLVMEAMEHSRLPLPEFLLWPSFLFTVRIMNFPLLLLSLFALVCLIRRDPRAAWILAGGSALFVSAFLCRNFLLTGYLFYPSMSFDLFPADWKADRQTTAALMDFIRQFNKVATQHQSPDVTRAMSLRQWVPTWFRHLFSYDRLLLCCSLAGMVMSVVLAGIYRSRAGVTRPAGDRTVRAARVFIGALVLQLIIWFLLAPDPRFVYGPLLCGLAWPVYLAQKHRVMYRVGLSSGLAVAVLLLIGIFTGFTLFRKDSAYLGTNLVFPAMIPQPGLGRVMIGTLPVSRPGIIRGNWNPRCYDTDLPCVYDLDPRIELRGASIGDGFRLSGETNK